MKSKTEKDKRAVEEDTQAQIGEWEEEWYWDCGDYDEWYDCDNWCPYSSSQGYEDGIPICMRKGKCFLINTYGKAQPRVTIEDFFSVPGKIKVGKQNGTTKTKVISG